PTAWYRESGLHRAIIEHAKPGLLRYFDHPTTSSVGTQDWPRRFGTEIGPVVYRLLEKALPTCRDVFQPEGVLALCREAMAQPSRAIYHVLRVLSFALGRMWLEGAASGEYLPALTPRFRGPGEYVELSLWPAPPPAHP